LKDDLRFREITFGWQYLSQSQPQAGAVIAYIPPLMTNISPKTTGLKLNCLRCGSRVACKNPMLILVTTIDIEAIITPGILKTLITPVNHRK
jgi:hypothetical protein